MPPRCKTLAGRGAGLLAAALAMKLGAVDFIAKPFSPQDIRELATRVLARQRLAEPDARGYRARLELAKQGIRERNFAAALGHARRAVGQDPYRAEGFNLVGALHEIPHDRSEALKNYRLAVEVDPWGRASARPRGATAPATPC
jgi:hypothetical protein